MRRRLPTEDTSEIVAANSVSALGLVNDRLALRPHRGKHVAPEAILARASFCEHYDPHRQELHIP